LRVALGNSFLLLSVQSLVQAWEIVNAAPLFFASVILSLCQRVNLLGNLHRSGHLFSDEGIAPLTHQCGMQKHEFPALLPVGRPIWTELGDDRIPRIRTADPLSCFPQITFIVSGQRTRKRSHKLPLVGQRALPLLIGLTIRQRSRNGSWQGGRVS
jgi:hypothetical protein